VCGSKRSATDILGTQWYEGLRGGGGGCHALRGGGQECEAAGEVGVWEQALCHCHSCAPRGRGKHLHMKVFS
jgi:hypothetical protein